MIQFVIAPKFEEQPTPGEKGPPGCRAFDPSDLLPTNCFIKDFSA